MEKIIIPELLRSDEGPRLPLFRVRLDFLRNPRNDTENERLVLESSDWVNIVALDSSARVVTVKQYRSGVGAVTTEIPGGIVEPGEESLQAAKRELLEETGFAASDWTYLGAVETNPAIFTNLCHHWLALDAEKKAEPDLDSGEDIQVACMTIDELKHEFETGKLRHALALSAISRIPDIWNKMMTRAGDS